MSILVGGYNSFSFYISLDILQFTLTLGFSLSYYIGNNMSWRTLALVGNDTMHTTVAAKENFKNKMPDYIEVSVLIS